MLRGTTAERVIRRGVAHAFLGSVAEELPAAAPPDVPRRPGLVSTAVCGPTDPSAGLVTARRMAHRVMT